MAEMELDSPGAVEQEAPEGAGSSTGAQDSARQPETDKAQRVNLDELEDFRKWKSNMDRQISAITSQLTAEQQRAAAAEQRFHEAQMQGMDELQRANYEKALLQQKLAEVERQRQLDFYAWQRQQDIEKVARKKGLQPEELAGALPQGADSFVLWEVADDLAAKRQTAQFKQTDPVRQAANTVDIGGGKPSGPASRYQQMYDEAKKSFDVGKMLDAMAAAGREGHQLRE